MFYNRKEENYDSWYSVTPAQIHAASSAAVYNSVTMMPTLFHYYVVKTQIDEDIIRIYHTGKTENMSSHSSVLRGILLC